MDRKGFILALGAYILWGLFPIYWKWLSHIRPIQVIGHRIVWSFLLLLGILLITRQFTAFRQAAFNWHTFYSYAASAIMIGSNWLVYVWAVNSNFIVEASLGYFINPLISVLLGVIFLHEHLRSLQWILLLLAGSGVIYLSVVYGRLPWIALFLATSFSIYGLIKKVSPLGSFFGLTYETGIIFSPALLYLLYLNVYKDVPGQESLSTCLLLIGSGIITSITMLMFSSAAKKLPLALLGIMEYIAPSLAFLLGVLVYKEPFDQMRLLGFGIVWISLVLFTFEGLLTHSRNLRATFPPRLRRRI